MIADNSNRLRATCLLLIASSVFVACSAGNNTITSAPPTPRDEPTSLATSSNEMSRQVKVLKGNRATPPTPMPPIPVARRLSSPNGRVKPYAFQQGSDSSDDVCFSWCVIAGQTVEILPVTWGNVAPSNATSVALMISNPPAGVNTSWDPVSPAGPSYSSKLKFTVPKNSMTPNELYPYGYYAIWTLSDGTTTTTSVQPEDIDVACSINAKTCPFAEVVDNSISPPNPVSGSPPPLTTVTAGLQMYLLTRWKQGTGIGGSFSVDTADTLAGQLQWATNDPIIYSGNMQKSYALTTAGADAVPLSPSDLSSPDIKFYVKRPYNPGNAGDPWHVQTPLVRADAHEHSNDAEAMNFNVLAPTVSNDQAVSQTNPSFFSVPASPTPYPAFGVSVAFDYAAQAPTSSGGLFAVVQTIGNSIAYSPGPSAPSTNYVTDLDTCLSYGAVIHGSSGSSVDLNASNGEADAPTSEVLTSQNSEMRSDYFDDYSIFQPDAVAAKGSQKARTAYWIPLAHSHWQWNATETQSPAGHFAFSNPGGTYTYAGDTGAEAYPRWQKIYAPSNPNPFPTSQPPGANCASIPK